MLSQLLGANQSSIISTLTKTLGVSGDQAGSFFTKAISMLEGALKGGKLDPSALLKGDVSSIASKLDMGSLSKLLGGDTAKATQGLGAIIGPLSGALKSKGGDLTSLLGLAESKGGMTDAVKSAAGKLFGR